jgi:16S rRNA (guanine527-N7)-methyltransferase
VKSNEGPAVRLARARRLAEILAEDVSRETFEKLEVYVALLREENTKQNLISPSSLEHVWERHIYDSAQLVRYQPKDGDRWVDIGSGAGLPGIVIACLVRGDVTLIEPRRLRADFLHKVSESLELRASVRGIKVERAVGIYDVITARAVAPLTQLLKISAHLSTGNTVWALPKGRGAGAELAEARRSWQGVFHLEPSVTNADSFIVVATGVREK